MNWRSGGEDCRQDCKGEGTQQTKKKGKGVGESVFNVQNGDRVARTVAKRNGKKGTRGGE